MKFEDFTNPDGTNPGHSYCPACGAKTLRLIEAVPGGDGTKLVMTCYEGGPGCGRIVNIFVPPPADRHEGRREDAGWDYMRHLGGHDE